MDVINNAEFIGRQFYVCALIKSNYSRPIVKLEPCMVTAVTFVDHSANAKKQIKPTEKAILVKTAIRTGVINYDTVISPVELKSGRRQQINIFDNIDECKAHYATLL